VLGKKAYPKFNNVLILAGGAGSGKGFALSSSILFDGKVFDVDAIKLAAIQSETISKRVKKEKGVDLKSLSLKNPDDVMTLHGLVGDIASKNRASVISSAKMAISDRKPNLIFDVTLKDIKKLKDISDSVTKIGYKKENIHIVWVMNSYKMAAHQNATRDRVVPADILLQTHKGAALTMSSIMKNSESTKKYMDGDIWVSFAQKDVDTKAVFRDKKNLTKSHPDNIQRKGQGFYVKDANFVQVKKKKKGITKWKDIMNSIVSKINDYTPKDVVIESRNKINTVYFDLDGVLADFVKEVKNRLGKTPDQIGHDKFKNEFVKDLYDDNFFPSLSVISGSKSLFDWAMDTFVNVEILSSVGKYKSDMIKKQKTAWVRKYISGSVKINFTTSSKDKAKYATKDTLLIDDRDKSVIPFSKAGGESIKFTSPKQAKKQLSKYEVI